MGFITNIILLSILFFLGCYATCLALKESTPLLFIIAAGAFIGVIAFGSKSAEHYRQWNSPHHGKAPDYEALYKGEAHVDTTYLMRGNDTLEVYIKFVWNE